MIEIQKPSRQEIDKVKQIYKNWMQGISLHLDRLDWAGEDYLLERAQNFSVRCQISRCWDSGNTDFSNAITTSLTHRIAIEELLEANELPDLKEESKKRLKDILEKSKEWMELIAFESIDLTRQRARRAFLVRREKPQEKITVKKEYLNEKDLKRHEQIWKLVKGIQPKKIRDKADLIIYNVHHYSGILKYAEDKAEEKRVRKKLRDAVVDAVEVKKMISWWLETREGRLFPSIKQWMQTRLLVLEYIIEEFVL